MYDARRHGLQRVPDGGSILDHMRVQELTRRIDRGEDELDAFWAIAVDSRLGYARYRGASERPPELVLRRRLTALLRRSVPSVVASARDSALSRLAGLSDHAIHAVEEVVKGEFTDGHIARARLDATRLVLAAVGISERSAVVATQVNVASAPTGLAAVMRAEAERSSRDPPAPWNVETGPAANGVDAGES